MNDLNTILLEGKLTKDPQITVYSTETEVCSFPIAVNRYYYKKSSKEKTYVQDVSFFIVECWGHMASLCSEYLKKGRGIRVIGRLKQTTWTGCTGPREKIYIIAEHIEFQPKHDKKENSKTQEENKILRPSAEENEKMESAEVERALDNSSLESEEEFNEPEYNEPDFIAPDPDFPEYSETKAVETEAVETEADETEADEVETPEVEVTKTKTSKKDL